MRKGERRSTRLTESDPLTADLSFVRRCADEAVDAICQLWDENRATFWRSTAQRASREADTPKDAFFPTVSLRCVNALFDLLFDHPEWIPEFARDLLLNKCVPSIVKREAKDLDSSLNIGREGKEVNLFTLSLYLRTFAGICSLGHLATDTKKEAAPKLQRAATELLKRSTLQVPDGVTINAHPFLLYHARYALEASLPHITDDSLKASMASVGEQVTASVRTSIERLLTKHKLGSLNSGEAVALAFCAATLARFGVADDRQHILTSLEVSVLAQDAAGCWPLGRVVRGEKDIENDRLEIATSEIAWVIAEAVLRLSEGMNQTLSDDQVSNTLCRLVQAARFAERTRVRLSGTVRPSIGWCTDHPYGVQMVESWTSATVLQSMVSLSKLADAFRRQSVLKGFATVVPGSRDWPSWLKWEKFRTQGEVDHEHPVLAYIHERLVRPILENPRKLPSPEARSVSALLFGPPGTSKTTVVKAVADGLGWPVVLLSPGTFIERGLEYIEAQTRSVFDRLMQLSHAVAIFDECDELFRDRQPLAASEQTRSITAFVTASMLPKLQELHDGGRIVFFICTNNFQSIDPAIKRGGRIDHILGIGPPDRDARAMILQGSHADLKHSPGWKEPGYFAEALEELASLSDRFTRPELQRAARLLARDANWGTKDVATKAARLVVEQMKEGLTITVGEFETFGELKKKYSQAFTEGV